MLAPCQALCQGPCLPFWQLTHWSEMMVRACGGGGPGFTWGSGEASLWGEGGECWGEGELADGWGWCFLGLGTAHTGPGAACVAGEGQETRAPRSEACCPWKKQRHLWPVWQDRGYSQAQVCWGLDGLPMQGAQDPIYLGQSLGATATGGRAQPQHTLSFQPLPSGSRTAQSRPACPHSPFPAHPLPSPI